MKDWKRIGPGWLSPAEGEPYDRDDGREPDYDSGPSWREWAEMKDLEYELADWQDQRHRLERRG